MPYSQRRSQPCEQSAIAESADNQFIKSIGQGGPVGRNPAVRLYGWGRDEAQGWVSHDLLQTRFPEPRAGITGKLLGDREWEGELA